MPGLLAHHKLPEFTQTHAPRVGDVIQSSHPLLSPSPPAPNPIPNTYFNSNSNNTYFQQYSMKMCFFLFLPVVIG